MGTGTFARVWLCRFKNAQKQDREKVFALKVLKKVDVVKLKQVEHVRNERNVLAAVAGHPFITQMLASFSDRHSLYMLLEYTPGGEIFSYLRRARRFPFATVQPPGRRSEDWVNSISGKLGWNTRQKQKNEGYKKWDS